MSVRRLPAEQVVRHRSRLIQFLKKYGDRRLTASAIRWLARSPQEAFDQPGNGVWVALNGKKLTGVLLVEAYGKKESAIAVHTHFRKQGVAKEILKEALKDLERLYGRVALDNIPSLKMCFSTGFVAFALTRGPTGKPTVWVGVGDWSRDEIAVEP